MTGASLTEHKKPWAWYKPKLTAFTATFSLCAVLAGCENMEEYPKAQKGVVTGATIGAVLGALSGNTDRERRENAQKGAVLGALIGGGIGLHLDAEDRRRQRIAAERAVTRNIPVNWSNPSTGVNGRITPVVSTSGPGCGTYKFESGRNGTTLNRGNFRACLDSTGRITSLPI